MFLGFCLIFVFWALSKWLLCRICVSSREGNNFILIFPARGGTNIMIEEDNVLGQTILEVHMESNNLKSSVVMGTIVKNVNKRPFCFICLKAWNLDKPKLQILELRYYFIFLLYFIAFFLMLFSFKDSVPRQDYDTPSAVVSGRKILIPLRLNWRGRDDVCLFFSKTL